MFKFGTLTRSYTDEIFLFCLCASYSSFFLSFFSGQVLLKNILKPLVMYASLELIVSEQHGEGTTLGLECLEEENKERSTPSQVYKKLLLLLKTLHMHLLGRKAYNGIYFYPEIALG